MTEPVAPQSGNSSQTTDSCIGAGCLVMVGLVVILVVVGVFGNPFGGESPTATGTDRKNENGERTDALGGTEKESSGEDVSEERKPEEPKEGTTVGPSKVDPNLAEIYVYGDNMESGGGDYWVEWSDETGVVESDRKTGQLPNEDKRIYREDIFWAPADGSNEFEVTAGKQTDWEGDLSVLLKVGGEWRDCSATDSPYQSARVHLHWTIGSEETAPACQSHFWFD